MENNIIEGNKAIAEFMGGKGHDGVVTYYVGPDGFQAESGTHLKYNRSWSWLMPVVEKIESLGHKTIIGGGDVWGQYMNIMMGVSLVHQTLENPSKVLGQAKTKIEATWQAVVEFINWHNQNQSNGKTGRGD